MRAIFDQSDYKIKEHARHMCTVSQAGHASPSIYNQSHLYADTLLGDGTGRKKRNAWKNVAFFSH